MKSKIIVISNIRISKQYIKKCLNKQIKRLNKTNFFSSNAKFTLAKLNQAFIILLLLCQFKIKYFIRIKTNVYSYTIGEILS